VITDEASLWTLSSSIYQPQNFSHGTAA